MATNKVYFGNTKVMDISDSTVVPETLKKDEVAYNAAGQKIIGTMEGGSSGQTVKIPTYILKVSGNQKSASATTANSATSFHQFPIENLTELKVGDIAIDFTESSSALTRKELTRMIRFLKSDKSIVSGYNITLALNTTNTVTSQQIQNAISAGAVYIEVYFYLRISAALSGTLTATITNLELTYSN